MLDMSSEAHWSNRDSVISHLAIQLARGRLSVFVGAGLSYNVGIPTWDPLLGQLCGEHGMDFPPIGYPTNPTPLSLAGEIRSKFSDTSAFLDSVQRNLYLNSKIDFADLAADKTLVALGALAMSSARGGVASVLSLNFDDCLECYLEGCGFVVDSVSEPGHWASRADITIYHPHGFLPSDASRTRSKDIVFDQASFSDVTGRRDSSWYQRLVTILRNSTVLLIGIGTGDANLLAMLKNASEDHPAKID